MQFKTFEEIAAFNQKEIEKMQQQVSPGEDTLEKNQPRRTPYNNTLAKIYPIYTLRPIGVGYKLDEIISNIKSKKDFEYFGDKYLADTAILNKVNNKTVIGYVNSRYGFVNPINGYVRFKVEVNSKEKKVEYLECFNYDSNITNTTDAQYAILIGSHNFQDFLDLANYLGFSMDDINNTKSHLFVYMQNQFSDAFKNRALENLTFLYAQAPPIILKERGDELLWFDFVKIGRFGWEFFSANTTSALLNLLWGFSSPVFLYTRFIQNQDILMSTYEGIDTYENKHVFCSFLIALTQALQAQDLATQNQTEYSVVKFDGAQSFGLEASYENGYIRIKNEKINYEAKHAGKAGSITQEKDRTLLLEKSYSPMALLYYEYTDAKGEKKKTKVPALYVLYMVQHSSYENTWKNIRLGFDVLVMLASLHPLVGGAARGLRFGLLMLDTVLSATDIIVLSVKDTEYLMDVKGECPEASWFVENWDTIYMLLGMGALSVQLVDAVASKGPILIRFLKMKGDNLTLVEKVAALLKTINPMAAPKALKEVEVVAPKAKTLFEEIGFGKNLKEFFTEELNLQLVKSRTSNMLEVIYKEVKVYEGEEKEVKKWLDELHLKNTKKTQKWLEGLVEERNLLKEIEKAIEKLGIEIKVPKNLLNAEESEQRMEKIYATLKGMKKSNKFNPSKSALKERGYNVNLSTNGISADFRNTQYLYKTSGDQRNIVRIKLTGIRENDDKLAFELAGIKPDKQIKNDFTWHHMNNFDPINGTCEMQLVDHDVHVACKPHYGSTALVDYFFQKPIYSKKLTLNI